MADFDGQYSDARIPCKTCGRSFAPEVLKKHSNICKKNAVSSQKRKTFDSSKQRVVEGEISYKQIRQAQKQVIAPPKSHWREKHADFINAIRNAKGVQKAIDSGGPLPPPPPPSINPDYIQCPYCSRRFNKQAAERHINFCKEQQSRLPRAKPDASATAKQNARLGYQAPRLKPKATPGAPPVGSVSSRSGPPPGRGQASRGGAAPSRVGAAPSRGRAVPTQDAYEPAGDSRGGGRGKQLQHRAGTGPRADSSEQHPHNNFPQKQQQQKLQHQRQHQHYRQQSSPDLEAPPGDFYSTPRDFYTPYLSPAPHSSGGNDGGYNSARYTDNVTSHTNKNNNGYAARHHQQHYGGSSNGSLSPYQNVEERSRRADGVPVRARVSQDAQHHFLSTVDSEDGPGGSGRSVGAPGNGSSSRRGHLQTTPAPFCYECGSKYPVASAKFCCQCGVKRASCR